MEDNKNIDKVIYVVGDKVQDLNDKLNNGWHIKEMHPVSSGQGSARMYVWLTREQTTKEPA